MTNKIIGVIVISCLLMQTADGAGIEKNNSVLRIYLPREIAIEGDRPVFEQVTVMRGDEALIAKAGEISLGHISKPGQKIVIDRILMLSRLASNGIPMSKVEFTGAEKITIKQRHQIIKGDKFVEIALSFAKNKALHTSICQWDVIRVPKDVIICEDIENVKLLPQLVSGGAKNQAKVQVSVFLNGKKVAVRKITFRLKFNCNRYVTIVDVPRAAIISPENVEMKKVVSDYPDSTKWAGLSSFGIAGNGNSATPYGLIARRLLPANTVLIQGMVGPMKPKILLKRNQSVPIIINRGGLFVTAIGKTLQEGKLDEYIRVRNVDSQRIILAKVKEDGSVEPVF